MPNGLTRMLTLHQLMLCERMLETAYLFTLKGHCDELR